ncbi:MAG: hypothetical protein IJF12_01240 [Alphaproteobacteria bacterium]|nr:hypothetical protein [Alphaproteobacteria bacterium]
MSKILRSLLKARKREENIKIPTKLGIVYAKKNKEYESLPYLDVARRHRIFGVSIPATLGGKEIFWIALEDSGKDLADLGEYRGLSMANEAYAKKMSLPCYDDMLRMYLSIDEINEVIDLLKKYGVSADRLNGPYIIHDKSLGSDIYSCDDVLIFHLKGERAATYQEVGIYEPNCTRLVKQW